MSEDNKLKTNHVFYLDFLRALAIISVVLIHACRDLDISIVRYYAPNSIDWITATFFMSFSNWGVGLFLVVSGALLLGRNEDIKQFLSKRIPRVTIPFLFWGFVLSMLLIAVSYFKPNFLCVIESFDILSILTYIYNSYMVNNLGFTPYWFFWMILGVYLVMPVFNKWIRNSDIREVEYFLVIWLVTCLFDFTLFISFPIKLTYFSGPIGCIILGYYLRNTERKLLNNPYFGIILCVASYLLMVALTFALSPTADERIYEFNRYSIIVVAEIIGIFIFAKNFHKLNINIGSNNVFARLISSLALYSYGIYLIHRVILVFVYTYIAYRLSCFEMLFCYFFATLIISWAVLAILNRVPYLNRVIGVK